MVMVVNVIVAVGLIFFLGGLLQTYLNYRARESMNLEVKPFEDLWAAPQFKTQHEIFAFLVAGGAVTHKNDTRIRIEFKQGRLTGYSTFHEPTKWRKV